jgi:HK97 family phage major capsid protein
MSISNQALLEINELQSKAERLSRGSASDRAQATALLGRIKSIRTIGLSSDEMRVRYCEALAGELGAGRDKQNDAEYRKLFDRYITGDLAEGSPEFRDFSAGTQSILYTQGAAGGYLIPFAYDPAVREAMSQVDEILDPDVTDFSMTSGPFLQPQQVSGYDLSTVSGQLVGEAAQQTAQVVPAVAGATLRSNLIFRATFGATLEAETDIPDFASKIVRAASVALARTIGLHVLTGRGGSDITGIATTLTSSYTNATSGKITLTDLNAIYFGVNRWYRKSPKAGWLVSDGVYKFLRAATDTSGRPLLDVIDDQEMLLGKPVYLCPSLGATYLSLGLTGALIFGDLSHIVIRTSRPTIQRTAQQGITDITRGECLYIARCRADATVFDPSNGSTPPLVLATIN